MSEQLACAKRELALRKNTYPRMVQSKRMSSESAAHETQCMTEIVNTLQKMTYLEQVSLEIRGELNDPS